MSRKRLPSGLKIEDITVGTGAVAGRGKLVTIHYRGFLNRGDQFRSSRDEGQPISFVVGKREMIAGLEYGVEGMRVGGHRQLIVSPHLAYRDTEIPGIPANAVLCFEVDLLDVQEVASIA